MKKNIITINNVEIVIKGKFFKIAQVRSDWYQDIEEPELIIKKLKTKKTKIDVFTFMQRLPETDPKFKYHMVWDNVAAIPVETYDKWYNSQIKRQVRNKIKKSIKKGVVIKKVDFNDNFAKQMALIINETPIRQGRRYWHYGKGFDMIKKEHMTFLDKSTFFGAYFKDELIGFIKLINVKKFITSMGILSMVKHRDKSPMSTLIAKAVELCATNNIPYLMYDKAEYGKKKKGTLFDFKRYNGYKKYDLPRYYIPLSLKGQLVIKLRLYRRLNEYFPEKFGYFLLNLREKYYTLKYKKVDK